MAHGRDWFREPARSPLVLWWHGEEGYPQCAEGVRRHHHLHDHGPGPDAFTFARAYDPAGARVRINKARVRASAPPG